MKTKIGVLKAVLVGVVALASAPAQADIIKHFVRLGAFGVDYNSYAFLTTSGADTVTFTGSGKFTIWYTAECAATGYVDVDIIVAGIAVIPTGNNGNDTFCDPETRGAMHTVTGRTHSLPAGTHSVRIHARKSVGSFAFLSDSSLLIGK